MNQFIKSIFVLCITIAASQGVYAQEIKVSLQEALQMAKSFNRMLAAERLESKASSEMYKESKGLYKPSIAMNATYSYYFNRPVIYLRNQDGSGRWDVEDVEIGGRNVFNAYLSLYQPIFNESIRREIKTARLSEALQSQSQLNLESSLIEEVSSTYYTVLLLQQKMALNEQSLLRNSKSLSDSRELFFQGKGVRSDTLRNFIAVENLKSSQSYLKDEFDLELMKLKRLLGMSHRDGLILTDTLTAEHTSLESITDEEIAQAVDRREDIKKLVLAKEIRKNLISQAKAAKLPQIGLVGMYQLQSQSDHLHLSSYAWPQTSYLGIQGTIPLINGNRSNLRIKHNRTRLMKSELELEDMKESAKIEIVTTLAKLRGAKTQVVIHSHTVDAAKINFATMEERYRSGLASRLELTDAELTLTQSKVNFYEAVYRYRIMQIHLQRATGQLYF